MNENEPPKPEAGVADAMALAARTEGFGIDEALEALTQRVNFLSSRILEMEERVERHARLCELRHRDDAEDIAKLRKRPYRAAGGKP